MHSLLKFRRFGRYARLESSPSIPHILRWTCPQIYLALSLEAKKAFGVLAEDLLFHSLRHVASLAPASDVVFFRRGIAVRKVRGAHEGVFSHMFQEIIEILVSFAVHERPSRTEELLRITVVAAVNGIINGTSLPARKNYAGRLYPAPDLLRRVGDPGGAGLQEAKPELGKTGQQTGAHSVHEAPHDGNNRRTKKRVGIGKELSYLRRAPPEMNANGKVKSGGLFIDRKKLRIGQIPLPHHAHGENTRSAQFTHPAHLLDGSFWIAKREQRCPPDSAFGLGAGLTYVGVVGVKQRAFELHILRHSGEEHGGEDYLAVDMEPIQVR